MKSYLIETSVIIDYLKGKEQARTLINSVQGNFTSSYFCLAELYEGIKRARDPEKDKHQTLAYFDSLTKIYGLNTQIAKKFGELRARLKKEGM